MGRPQSSSFDATVYADYGEPGIIRGKGFLLSTTMLNSVPPLRNAVDRVIDIKLDETLRGTKYGFGVWRWETIEVIWKIEKKKTKDTSYIIVHRVTFSGLSVFSYYRVNGMYGSQKICRRKRFVLILFLKPRKDSCQNSNNVAL